MSNGLGTEYDYFSVSPWVVVAPCAAVTLVYVAIILVHRHRNRDRWRQ